MKWAWMLLNWPGVAASITRMQRSPLRWLGWLVACCWLVIACQSPSPPTGEGPGSSPSPPPGPGRLVLGTTARLRTLDPADAYEILSNNLLYNLGDRLYVYTSSGPDAPPTLTPQLATALPQVSADGLTYVIPLRQGVKFHDGTPFNAEAMAFSLRRFIENGGTPSFLLADTIATVEATGELELTIRLKTPFVAFPSLLTIPGTAAVSPQAYERGVGKFNPSTFVGTGPYQLTEYRSDRLRLDAFADYWGEPPANPGLDIQIFSSPANLYNSFRTGAIDVAYQNLDPDQINRLKQEAGTGGWQVIEGAGNGIHYLTLNVKSPPFDQVAVRQALAASIDRPLLQSRVFQGLVEPLYSLIPNTLADSVPVFKDAFGDGNAAQALQVLAQAGYSAEKPLEAQLWYRSNLTSNSLAANLLKAWVDENLKGVMRLDLQSVESATAYQNLDKGIYPSFMLDWTPDFLDADSYIHPFLACAQGSPETGCQEGSSKAQGSFYYSAAANQLIDRSRQETDPQKRQQIFKELQAIVAQDVPFIPLWQNKEFLFVQKQVSGAALTPIQTVAFAKLSKG
ncbi:ABC transporter substrate-binding protein [Trichothermofontia sichuanensis B231]|uniref:ABC transporter substrate-binding protein n=1 Tax=Trichothermofontia sichuanensis TaxID=3045816 RepID=UPI002247DA50|nr:ABC transporter substrate-binding protein [Trichothermofontia sichuanensis]UZQ54243.1 ABC transporter substrate-binding protein [Trichothermofontia sichuanensis B231]